jgi:hypothetical protein
MATVFLIQLLSGHVLGETAAGPIVEYFSQVWRDILAKRAFSVRSPATNGPLILAALNDGNSALAKLANLILVSEASVSAHLSSELRRTIWQISHPKSVPPHQSADLSDRTP